MIPHYFEDEQKFYMNRETRRKYEKLRDKVKKKLTKKIKKGTLDVEFTNETVTSCGTFAFIEAFKTTIQLKEMIQEHIITKRAPNAKYPYDVLIDQLIDALLLGHLRYKHTNILRNDPGYLKIKDMEKISEETTKRKAFLQFSEEQINEFKKLNQKLVSLLLSFLPCQSVWINADDTVITVFSDQEKSAKGYNPKYPGRNSYKAKVMALSEHNYIINMGLYSGDTASNGDFYEHLEETLAMMQQLRNITIEGIRLDKGFFDQKTFQLLEDLNIYYVCKVPLIDSIKKMIDYLNEEDKDRDKEERMWTPISKGYASAELTVPLKTWEKARRFIFIRKESIVLDQDSIFPEWVIEYNYEVIVTNLIDETPEEVWHQYNLRADVENRIDELKQGVGLDQASQVKFNSNEFLTIMKTIAYNLLQGFKRLLPMDMHSYEIPRLRREFLHQQGNVIGQKYNMHIRLVKNPRLQKIITILKRKLKVFVERLATIQAVEMLI